MRQVYLDNSATTPIEPLVLEEMLPYLRDCYGNPSSLYSLADKSVKALKQARDRVSSLLNCDPEEIVFTSCATESNNTALHSAIEATNKRHVITTNVEHKAILEYCKFLSKRRGVEITQLSVDKQGNLDLMELEKSIRNDTAIVSIMAVNNETGITAPMDKIAAIVKSRGVLLHTDAVQAVGKVDIDLQNIQVDYLSLSGHKIYSPKGVGVLFIRKGTPFVPMIYGGGQEKGKRAGTENVASIVGLGKSCELLKLHANEWRKHISELRDYLETEILKNVPNAYVNGDRSNRVCSISNISFEFIESEAICLLLDKFGIMVSTGSACSSTSLQPSHVLSAMKIPFQRIHGSIRFSLSHNITKDDIDYTIERIKEVISELRRMSPLYKQL